tara:strand:- start:3262 stop:5367 length:2106 start_codon:yes stop_codon:yes gene_type:complete
MSATPLIRPLRVQGGTIYVFNSAANDIAKTFSDDNFRFTFSKFAALDLPKVQIPNNNSNNINWQAVGNRQNSVGSTGAYFDTTVLNDMINGNQQQNTFIANNFQNYVLNWENLILNQDNSDGNGYDSSSQQSITERIFWKWVADLGAIRFDDASEVDSNIPNLFVEEAQNTDNSGIDTYNRVVKYLGDIDLINNVNRGGEAYTQVYLHIPTEHGNTPTVLFNNITDINYNPTLKWYGTNGDNIEGRTEGADPRMSAKAYFQDNSNGNDYYSTQNTFGSTANTTIEISNDMLGTNPYEVKVSDMDGTVIDWDSAKYTKVTSNPSVKSISELNSTAEAEDFSFNTVLIYYDIYDESDSTIVKRNLYGVLFLDDFTETISDGSSLNAFAKYKPNAITKLNGNAYSLKTNIKFDTSADNVGVERSINEFTTFSMDLFSDAMVSLQDSTQNFVKQSFVITELTAKVDNLEKFYFNQATIDELNQEITDLTEVVQNAMIALESPTTLIELIRNNSDRINKLASGNLTSTLSYDLSPFVQGAGLKVDKSVPNKVIISNIVEGYNNFPTCYNDAIELNYSVGNGVTDITDTVNYPIKNNILSVGKFTNYFKNNTTTTLDVDTDLVINLDDSVEKFKTGQVFRLVFANEFTLKDTRNIFIYTDASNVKQQGAFKWLVTKITKPELISSKPIIEIICTNAVTLEFTIDVLR